MNLSKRQKAFSEKIKPGASFAINEAIKLVKECATAKFDEAVDIAVNLGIDAKRPDQNVRGATVLPNGTGKSMRVAVFADGELAKQAKAAGADIVGLDDLAEVIRQGTIDFDVAIATPASMRVVGQLGPILGPRGLMPNPKVGSVTNDVATAVTNAKGGQVQYRTDKNGIIQCNVGKAKFSVEQLRENIESLIGALRRSKPTTAKGTYIKKITLSSTMGPGVGVDITSLSG